MKRNYRRELVVRIALLVVGLLAGILLGGAARAQEGEVVVLSYEECLSVGPALIAALKMEKYDIAISQNAQRVVDNAVPNVRKAFDEALKAGTKTQAEIDSWMATFPENDASECVFIALLNNGVVPVRLYPEPKPEGI